ncbi:hypothetical protein CDL15_Pgr005981 [Punica granatum]|uniref:Uncharacterized protein n=1 Tax=Punica granatum TaxID=22663 RepID=A0A218VWX0_PUNGR|nr:hypothetical protein CDL15_Pgr005981 [Punica granatum]
MWSKKFGQGSGKVGGGGEMRLGTGKVLRDPILDCSGPACWKLQMPKLTPEMDSGGQVRVGYEVWFGLNGGRQKTVEFSDNFGLEPGCAWAELGYEVWLKLARVEWRSPENG